MEQSLPGFLNLCLNLCSPSQILCEFYTKVLEAAHPLHRGPTDHKRSVGPLLSLPEVHNQLFSFAHIQRERDKKKKKKARGFIVLRHRDDDDDIFF